MYIHLVLITARTQTMCKIHAVVLDASSTLNSTW